VTGTSGSLSKSVVLPLTVTVASTAGGPATFKGDPSTNSPWFDEDDVLLTASAPLTALTVTIIVPATNVTHGSSYDTIGNQVVTSYTSGSNIVYVYTLAKGATISPGSYTFAAQMDGNGKAHLASGDSWTASYSSGGKTYTQSGSM